MFTTKKEVWVSPLGVCGLVAISEKRFAPAIEYVVYVSCFDLRTGKMHDAVKWFKAKAHARASLVKAKEVCFVGNTPPKKLSISKRHVHPLRTKRVIHKRNWVSAVRMDDLRIQFRIERHLCTIFARSRANE